jgi:hypothetical protein
VAPKLLERAGQKARGQLARLGDLAKKHDLAPGLSG